MFPWFLASCSPSPTMLRFAFPYYDGQLQDTKWSLSCWQKKKKGNCIIMGAGGQAAGKSTTKKKKNQSCCCGVSTQHKIHGKTAALPSLNSYLFSLLKGITEKLRRQLERHFLWKPKSILGASSGRREKYLKITEQAKKGRRKYNDKQYSNIPHSYL